MRKNLWLLFILLMSSGTALATTKCLQTKATLDIGSGTTKILVAQINKCQKSILKLLMDEKVAIPFNEDLDQSKDFRLSPIIFEKAVQKLTPLLEKARSYHPGKIKAVATSVFREALNGKEFALALANKMKLEIKVISQQQEAILGYQSAQVVSGNFSENILVWDIGGGSMQMVQRHKSMNNIYMGAIASVTFKNMLLNSVIDAPENQTSPNPLGNKANASLKLAEYYAKVHVPKPIKETSRSSQVLGIGGVFTALQQKVDSTSHLLTKANLEELLQQRKNLTDEQIPGDYKAVDVTNIILVLGFMKALGIEQVNTYKVNLTHGLLFTMK